MNRHDTGRSEERADGRDPADAFVDGQGPMAAALRELPAFEPPPRMAIAFGEMLAGLPGNLPGFEPPASLEAAVLGEITRQQDAQAGRRAAVLREVARGADPAAALDAELSVATHAWLRERSHERSPEATASSSHADHHDAGKRAVGDSRGSWSRWPAGWWRYAGGALAAVLALGIGIRMLLEPAPGPAPGRAGVAPAPADAGGSADAFADRGHSPSPAPPALKRQKPAQPARSQSASEAEVRRDALASRERSDRAQAMREHQALSATAPTMQAARPAPPGPAAAPATPGPGAGAAGVLDSERDGRAWRLSDDPAIRLGELPVGPRWILLCHPSDHASAEAWLEHGLDAIAADRTGDAGAGRLRGLVRIEVHDDVPAGELRPVPDNASRASEK